MSSNLHLKTKSAPLLVSSASLSSCLNPWGKHGEAGGLGGSVRLRRSHDAKTVVLDPDILVRGVRIGKQGVPCVAVEGLNILAETHVGVVRLAQLRLAPRFLFAVRRQGVALVLVPVGDGALYQTILLTRHGLQGVQRGLLFPVERIQLRGVEVRDLLEVYLELGQEALSGDIGRSLLRRGGVGGDDARDQSDYRERCNGERAHEGVVGDVSHW